MGGESNKPIGRPLRYDFGCCPTLFDALPVGPLPLQMTTGTAGIGLRAQAIGQGTYQWKRNSVDLPAATAQTYTATQPGAYTVAWTSATGGTALSQTVTVVEELAEQNSNGNALSYVREITVLKPGQSTEVV